MAKQSKPKLKTDPFRSLASPKLFFEARTPTQQQVFDLWDRSRLLFLMGASGSGKTFCALALALQEILGHQRDNGPKPKLMLSRPAVTCDEELGFVPGDLDEKLGPWLAPFRDVLKDLSTLTLEELMEQIEVELVPVGMLRGRTVSNAILILDESQNLSPAQVKCVLTRIGKGGRIILCGDQKQSDLYEDHRDVPLVAAARKLCRLDTVCVINFKEEDVVRDPLVREVLRLL